MSLCHSNVPTGCAVSFQISVNGNLSNGTFISIAPSGTATACVQAGFTTAQLQNFDQGGTFTVAGFDILSISENVLSLGLQTFSSAGGAITQFTGFQLSAAASSAAYTYSTFTAGACTVYTFTGTTTSTVTTSGGEPTLDRRHDHSHRTRRLRPDECHHDPGKQQHLFPVDRQLEHVLPGAVNGTIVGGTIHAERSRR